MKKLLAVVAALAAITIVVVAGYRIKSSVERNQQAAAGEERKASVAIAVAEKKEMPSAAAITGVLRAQNEAVIFPKMPGRVQRVAAQVGAQVKAGETLAALESVDLAYRVKQAEAQLSAARAGLSSATVQLRTATSGFERARGLHGKGSLSNVDFEQAQAGFELAKAGVQSAEAQVALAESNVGLAGQAYADSRITSPIAGVVAKRHVDVGAQASPMQPAFVVQDQTALKMTGTVAASDVRRLKVGMAVSVSVDEVPGRVFEGTLALVAPTLEQESRRAAIEVALAPAAELLPYMFGHAEIDFGERDDVVVVPATAVLPGVDGAVVYAVRDGKAVLVKPKLGARVRDEVVIVEGLAAGDRVIVSGDSGLKDGMPVAVADET